MSVKRIRRTLSSAILGIAGILCFAQGATAQDTYVITKRTVLGSVYGFEVTKGGVAVGRSSSSTRDIIQMIWADVRGKPCIIQFGDGTATLDIDEEGFDFFGSAFDFGLITFTGKLKSTLDVRFPALLIDGNISANSTADITSTGTDSGIGIFFHSTGSLTISGGTVSATNGNAVQNNSTGTVTISGGTVSATTGNAVYNASTGSVTISGGTVSATTGIAVLNASTGKITVSGTADVTSSNTSGDKGTIVLANKGESTAERLIIEDGRVRNLGNNVNANAINNSSVGAVTINGGTVFMGSVPGSGRAVYNNSTGAVTINGGTVRVNTGRAVFNNSTGRVTINGGALEARTGTAVYNASTGSVTISGGKITATDGYAVYQNGTGETSLPGGGFLFAYGANRNDVVYGGMMPSPPGASYIIAAWNQKAGNTSYRKSDNTDIFVNHSSMAAVWDNSGGKPGISYKRDANEGFIEIPGVTVSASTSVQSDARVGGTNPTGFVQVSGNALNLAFADRGNVAVYALNGAKVRAFDLGSGAHTLRMDGLPRGTYMVRAVSGSWGQSVRMLVK